MTETWYKPKLIEVGLPLEDINRESAREKSIRHGHPSTLHLWWARRPLAACRAVMFAQLVDDPSAHPDKFPTEEAQKAERERLHDIISRLVVWENIHDEKLYKEAHEEILKSTGGNPPPILDPFAGGGSIPLEAQRLGLEAHASDLNPVPVLINKALLEIPPKWAGHKPVFPGAAAERMSWPGSTGMAEDVRRYGKWMRNLAEQRVGNLYPTVQVGGVNCRVIAWIWARTATCPNPTCGGTMPLVRSFWLGKKKGKERYVTPVPEGKRIRFKIDGPDGVPRSGTISRKGAECLLCGTPAPLSYLSEEGKSGRIGSQLMAIAAEGPRQRYYIAPNEEHENAANIPRPEDVPDGQLSTHPQYMAAPRYGMTNISDLFTNRQLTMLTTYSDIVKQVQGKVISDGGEPEYAMAIATYMAFAISKVADNSSSLCMWMYMPSKEGTAHTFARAALPMMWDYAEGNPFNPGPCDTATSAEWIAKALAALPHGTPGIVRQQNAATTPIDGSLISTDPPYYDNVPYADLSDFFYAWLRRSLHDLYPDLLATILTPKADELVADQVRHRGKEEAEKFFEQGFTSVFQQACRETPEGFPITVFYAFRQSETDRDGGHASTGWETMLEGMLAAGWAVTATWPVRTERGGRVRDIGANALASSIVLACRPRTLDAGFTDRRGLIQALRDELPDSLRTLEQGKVAPVDLRQAAIGPGMAIFSRYERVNEPDGSAMRVRSALSLINQVVDEKLSHLEGNVSADTRFCTEWFKQFGFDEGPFGTAENLSKSIDTSISKLDRAKVLFSRAGKVRLRFISELPESFTPAPDGGKSEWEIGLHLAKRLKEKGTNAAAALMAIARDTGVELEDVRELTYLLYSIAEKKGWTETALLFNNLGTSWTDIEDASRRTGPIVQEQLNLSYGSDDDGDE